MKIVIDIPEKYLNSSNGIIDMTLFTGKNSAITDVNVENTYANFQVLPKGHGELICRNALKESIPEPTNITQKLVYRTLCNLIDNAPTIIEADKER